MNKSLTTIVLIVIGALLLIFSSGVDSAAVGVETTWFKIPGLIFLMWGLYRASRKTSVSEKNGPHDEEG